jgi:chloramphenicol 3-O phosphotransferase
VIESADPGQIVILNGPPRAGKSTIAAAIQESLAGLWLNIGVDVARRMTPARLQPGIGLRPGETGHPAAPFVPLLYAALYESIAAHSRLGVSVVVDVAHHERAILEDAARRLAGLPAIFVGVSADLETIMERRRAAGPGRYASGRPGQAVPEPVLRWQGAVHTGWTYDLELDTSRQSPQECARAIGERLEAEPPPAGLSRLLDEDQVARQA